MLNLFRLPISFGSSNAEKQQQHANNLVGGVVANYYKQHKEMSDRDFLQARHKVSNAFQSFLRQGTESPDQQYERMSAALRNIERDLR